MFWLAVSPVVTPPQTAVRATPMRLGTRDQKVWSAIESSVATLYDGAKALGPVVLIDDRGFFVAHQGAVEGNTVTAKLSETAFHLQVVSRERNSELVLLKADDFPSAMRAFHRPQGEAPEGTLFAVLGSGPIRASVSGQQRFGVVGSTRRGVPMSELRFEAPMSQFGTGLLLTDSMELYGTLNAALSNAAPPNGVNGFASSGQNIGPNALMVAYSVGPEFVRRVFDGFLSSSHEVVFPSLGVMCVDAIGGGALIQTVRKDSPADQAGLLSNDILLDIGGNAIRDQLDFARAMLKVEVGKKVVVRLRRSGQTQLREVILGETRE